MSTFCPLLQFSEIPTIGKSWGGKNAQNRKIHLDISGCQWPGQGNTEQLLLDTSLGKHVMPMLWNDYVHTVLGIDSKPLNH